MATLTGQEDALVGVYYSILGGTFNLRKIVYPDMPDYNAKSADVIGQDGSIIGYAHRIYSDGWAVHTKPYAGYVPDSQIVMVD